MQAIQLYGDTPDQALAAIAEENAPPFVEGPYGVNIVTQISKTVPLPEKYRYNETQKDCQARYPNDPTMAQRCTVETHALENAFFYGDMTLEQLRAEVKRRRPAKVPKLPPGTWVPGYGYTFVPDPSAPKPKPAPWWKKGGVDWRVIGGVGGSLLVLTLLLRKP